MMDKRCVLRVYAFLCGPIYMSGTPTPSHLFALSEHQVHEAADESHGEADPGQDEGRAVRAFPQTGYMKGVLLGRVDGCCDHHT